MRFPLRSPTANTTGVGSKQATNVFAEEDLDPRMGFSLPHDVRLRRSVVLAALIPTTTRDGIPCARTYQRHRRRREILTIALRARETGNQPAGLGPSARISNEYLNS